MTTATFFVPVNMHHWSFFYDRISVDFSGVPTRVRDFGADGERVLFSGTNLNGDEDRGINAGLITGIDYSVSGEQWYTIDCQLGGGIYGAMQAHDARAFLNGVFHGADVLVGSGSGDLLTGLSGRDRISGNGGDDVLLGGGMADTLLGGVGNDTLVGGGDADRVLGGAGNDSMIWGLEDRLDGGAGQDRVIIQGRAITVDLRVIADSNMTDVEIIDITGSGNLHLELTEQDVLAASSNGTLRIIGNAGDVVHRGDGWIHGADVVLGPNTYFSYTKGGATLLVDSDVTSAAAYF